MKFQNRYLELFLRLQHCRRFTGDPKRERLWRWRRKLVRRFAWAVPGEEALAALVELSPLVEIGAGRGYWARMIRERGGVVDARDISEHRGEGVLRGDAEYAGLYGKGWTLFLCWPPLGDPMASRALSSFKGDTLAYIGEPKGGCTGDHEFHHLLERDWEGSMNCALPRWEGINDELLVYRRRTSSARSVSP